MFQLDPRLCPLLKREDSRHPAFYRPTTDMERTLLAAVGLSVPPDAEFTAVRP